MSSNKFTLRGLASIFRLGKRGPQIKANGSVIELRDSGDAAFIQLRVADPASPDDVVNQRSGDAKYVIRLSPQVGARLLQSSGISGDLAESGIEITVDNDLSGIRNLHITGDLIIDGTTTQINSTVLNVEDKNITLATGATTDLAADGGGFTLKGVTDKLFRWIQAKAAWVSSEHIEVVAGKEFRIDGNEYLTTKNTDDLDEGSSNLYYTDARAQAANSAALSDKQNTSEKGQPNGYASLDADGLVPISQIPRNESNRKLIVQVSHGFVEKDWIRRDFGGGSWVKASAATMVESATSGVVSQIINADSFEIITSGWFATTGLTPGIQYLSDTAGQQSTTPGTIDKYLGEAISATLMNVNIQRGVIDLSGIGGGGISIEYEKFMYFFFKQSIANGNNFIEWDTPGVYNITLPTSIEEITYHIVGGGGGSGSANSNTGYRWPGSGGGSGEYVTSTALLSGHKTITIEIIGSGIYGNGGTSFAAGGDGYGPASISGDIPTTVTARSGGGGAGFNGVSLTPTGGSNGGGPSPVYLGGALGAAFTAGSPGDGQNPGSGATGGAGPSPFGTYGKGGNAPVFGAGLPGNPGYVRIEWTDPTF